MAGFFIGGLRFARVIICRNFECLSMTLPSFSYIACSFAGLDFTVRIESSLLAPALLSSSRVIHTAPAPAFCRGISPEYLATIEGNKLYKLAYYLENFASLPPVRRIWSHGSAQSNAMLALSALAQLKGAEFHYVVPYLPDALQQQPLGNLALALEHSMQLHIDSTLYRRMAQQTFAVEEDEWIFGEGASHAHLRHGFAILGRELEHACKQLALQRVFLPSGTGASACHLAASLPEIEVMTTPVYGDTDYLQEVVASMQQPGEPLPIILPTKQAYRFGSLYRELWELQAELLAHTGIPFDLLYDLPAWASILHQREQFKQPWLYLHQGGLRGSATMRERYLRMMAVD